MKLKKLAIASAVGFAMVGATAAQAHVTYNFATSTNSTTGVVSLNQSNGNATNGAGVWTDGPVAGYAGNLPVNWAAYVHNDSNPNASYTISTANALAGAASAGITPLSSFAIESTNNKWNRTQSWGNALDFGLIDLHAAGNLTITVAADTASGSNFIPGFTLFSGWDTAAGSSKHGSWNFQDNTTTPPTPLIPVNPRKSEGLLYVGEASTSIVAGVASYTFTNLNAGNYSLWIGGNGLGNTSNNQRYIATITASAVPVPGAVWLFGSALAGVMGLRKRKQAA